EPSLPSGWVIAKTRAKSRTAWKPAATSQCEMTAQRMECGKSAASDRSFNTYGPRMHPQDGRVVSNSIVQALKGEDITLYGDGSQTRSFCYVDDLVEGLIRLMNTPFDCRQVPREPDPSAILDIWVCPL